MSRRRLHNAKSLSWHCLLPECSSDAQSQKLRYSSRQIDHCHEHFYLRPIRTMPPGFERFNQKSSSAAARNTEFFSQAGRYELVVCSCPLVGRLLEYREIAELHHGGVFRENWVHWDWH